MAKPIQHRSIKDGGGMNRGKSITKNMNLGMLMRQYRDLDDILYPYASNLGLVYEDMDCTIEEFADMTGADVQELLVDINRVVNKSR